MPTWNADLYLRFAQERTRPAHDLAARIEITPRTIIDLGCGPGNSTRLLRERWPDARVVGLDSSPDMIATATKDDPQGQWLLGDIFPWTAAEPFDLVFSNAALQWVPGHAELFPRLFAQVAPGGALAVQMPFHEHSPLHQSMLDLSRSPRWSERLEGARNALRIEPLSFYYDGLCGQAARLDLWLTEYHHVLPNHEAILDWIRGTGLRPFVEPLDAAERQEFEAELLARVRVGYPGRIDGRVLFPFPRIFVVAYRAA